jgi:hypothetical protein
LVRYRQHEDRGAAPGRDDPACDLVAGRPGDVAVEDGEVVGVGAEQLERGGAVAGDVGRDGLQPETVADGLRQERLVLHDQHPHLAKPKERGISPAYASRYRYILGSSVGSA